MQNSEFSVKTPGLVDFQVNGFAGVDYNNPSLVPESFEESLERMLATGVTSCLLLFRQFPDTQFLQALRKVLGQSKEPHLPRSGLPLHARGNHALENLAPAADITAGNPSGQLEHCRVDQRAGIDDRINLLEFPEGSGRAFQSDTKTHRRSVAASERHADPLAGHELIPERIGDQVMERGVQRSIEHDLGRQPIGCGSGFPGRRRISRSLRGRIGSRFRRQIKETLLSRAAQRGSPSFRGSVTGGRILAACRPTTTWD